MATVLFPVFILQVVSSIVTLGLGLGGLAVLLIPNNGADRAEALIPASVLSCLLVSVSAVALAHNFAEEYFGPIVYGLAGAFLAIIAVWKVPILGIVILGIGVVASLAALGYGLVGVIHLGLGVRTVWEAVTFWTAVGLAGLAAAIAIFTALQRSDLAARQGPALTLAIGGAAFAGLLSHPVFASFLACLSGRFCDPATAGQIRNYAIAALLLSCCTLSFAAWASSHRSADGVLFLYLLLVVLESIRSWYFLWVVQTMHDSIRE